jgi:hypothetical protein
MKDSHFKTPRQLSDCQFPIGHCLQEVATTRWEKWLTHTAAFFVGMMFAGMIAAAVLR